MDDNLVLSMTWVVSLLLLMYKSHAPDPALGVVPIPEVHGPGLDGPALTLVNGSSSLLVSLFTPGSEHGRVRDLECIRVRGPRYLLVLALEPVLVCDLSMLIFWSSLSSPTPIPFSSSSKSCRLLLFTLIRLFIDFVSVRQV